jgi:phosphoglycerate dehydrogenase-like enzyme
VAVAELAMALMLALPNQVPRGDKSMHEGQWLKKEIKRTELFGKTLGILGIGRIGTEIAIRAKAFGMNIIAYDPVVKSHSIASLVPSMKDLLGKADYISLNTPLTDDTKGMFNKTTLAECKNGAYIVNTGRGKCMIEEDLVEALKAGKIAGYATDVWYSDPPENSPLMGAPNVIMMPHVGAETKENLLRIGVIVDQLIGEYVKK